MAANEQFVIRLGLNSSGVAVGVNSAVGQINRLYSSVSNVVQGFLALSVVRWTAGIVKDAIDLGGHLNDLADRSNTSVEKFQMWQHAISQSGGSIEALIHSLKEMSKSQIDALKGNSELRAAFARYGVTVEDLRKLNPEQLFDVLSAAFGRAQATAQVTSDVANILGKTGDELLPAFRNGFSETTAEAEELGIVLKRDITDELDRAGDELDILKDQFKKFTAGITATTLRGLRDTVHEIASVLVAGKIGAEANKSVGGGTTGSIVSAIISRLVKASLDQGQQDEEDAASERRKKRNQAAPGDVKPTKTEGNLAPNFQPDSDALARLGGFRGGTSEIQRIAPQQLNELRQANRHLQRIAQAADKGFADGVRDTQTRALLQRVDNYFRYGIDFDTEF